MDVPPQTNRPAFFHFQTQRMPELMAPYQEILHRRDTTDSEKSKIIHEVNTKLTQEWSRIQRAESDDDRKAKERWNKIAAADIERYQREWKEYNQLKNSIVEPQQQKTTIEDLASILGIAIEDLMCPICRESLFEPIILTCGHRFCAGCLEKTTRRFTHSKGAHYISCALCRHEQYIDFNRIKPDQILEAIMKKAQGDKYGEGRNTVDKETAVKRLVEWYPSSELALLIDDVVNTMAQQYLENHQGPSIIINPTHFLNALFGDYLSTVTGFPLGKLAYYHLQSLMTNMSNLRIIVIDTKVAIINIDYVTNDQKFMETVSHTQPWEEKEFLYQLKIYMENRVEGSPYFQNVIKMRIPDYFKDGFDISYWQSVKVIKKYFTETYDTIVASPNIYNTFNEFIKTLRE